MVTFNEVLPFITLLLGGLIGNRLALGRDRRKDFNDVANPLFEVLEKQRICALSGSFPIAANEIGQESFIAVIRKSPRYRRKGLSKAIDSYLEAKEKCGHHNQSGIFEFKNPDLLISAIKNLQKYVPHK